MRKKGFVDKGLYGLKEKLENQILDKEEKQDTVPITSTDKSISEESKKQDNHPTNEMVDEKTAEKNISKELKQALSRRKQEYLLTKNLVKKNISTALNKLPENISSLERELNDLKSAQLKMQDTLTEINETNEKEWEEDCTSSLGIAMKAVENARLQYLLLSSKISQLDDNSKNTNDAQGCNSIIPELTSINFSQLFKMGLGFFLPLIIGVIIASIIISVVIFVVMGGILL